MLFCGSYTHLLYGISVVGEDALKQEFLHSTHAAKVNCIAASGGLLATGSDDTSIWVFRSSTRKEVGQLSRHTGSVTALAFFKTKYLFSASQDGTIAVWRVKVRALSLGRSTQYGCLYSFILFFFSFFFFFSPNRRIGNVFFRSRRIRKESDGWLCILVVVWP